MTLLNKLNRLWNPKNREAEQALIYANKWSVFTRDSYRSQYIFLSKVDDYDWEYIITVICLFVIMRDIKGFFGNEAKESEVRRGLMEYIKASRLEGGLNAIADCHEFVESDPKNLKKISQSPIQYYETAIGYWALKAILGRDLDNAEELGAARAIGSLFNNAMHGFWSGQHIPLP